MKIETYLKRIFGKLQKVKPPTPHRRTLSFEDQFDEAHLKLNTEMTVLTIPHPAYWADSAVAWDSSKNFKWDQFQWSD